MKFNSIASRGDLLEQSLGEKFHRYFTIFPHGTQWKCYNLKNQELVADTLIELEEKIVSAIEENAF